jgi:K+:H+ antiporter
MVLSKLFVLTFVKNNNSLFDMFCCSICHSYKAVGISMDVSRELTELAIVTLIAIVCGLLLTRIKQPAIVGYILTGIVLGPTGFALIKDTAEVQLLAELGVLMLLFLVGMELSIKSFKKIYKTAFFVTIASLIVYIGIFYLLSMVLQWSIANTLLLSFVVSISSTAVVIKMLEDIGELRTHIGQVAIGLTIAQDLVVVPLLLVVKGLGSGDGIGIMVVVKIVASMGILAVLIWFLGRRKTLRIPFFSGVENTPDLVPIAALALCFGLGTISEIVGLSSEYGAFLAGLIIGNSTSRTPIMKVTHPIQSILLMVFFLSVGLLIDLKFIWEHLWTVLILLMLVTVVKSFIMVMLLRIAGESWRTAFPVGVAMSQLGEFSFVLAATGLSVGLLTPEEHRMQITVIVLTLVTSSFWLMAMRRFKKLAVYKQEKIKLAMHDIFEGEFNFIERSWRVTTLFVGSALGFIKAIFTKGHPAGNDHNKGRECIDISATSVEESSEKKDD